MNDAMKSASDTAVIEVTLKNYLASGTLLAPIQLPINAQVASEDPRGTSNATEVTIVFKVYAACASVLINPASTVINSYAHHSEPSIRMTGIESFR